MRLCSRTKQCTRLWQPPTGWTLHRAARPQALQPAHRPVRPGRHHLEHLLRLGTRTRLDPDPSPGLHRPNDAVADRIPALTNSGQLHHHPGDGQTQSRNDQRLTARERRVGKISAEEAAAILAGCADSALLPGAAGAQFAGFQRCLVDAPRLRDGKPSGIDQQTRIVTTLAWLTPAKPGDTVRGRGRLG